MDHRPGAVVAALQVVTATGTGFAPYLLAATAGLILAGRRPRTRTAQVVLACVGWLALGQAVRFGLMTLIARPRPPEADWLTHASRHAYPSGHATTSAMAAGLIVAALISRRPRGHRAWIALTLAWAAAVGASRVWLGVHWTTDVIAGWLLALTWTALAVAAAARIHTEGAA
ncbi:undecaprenyl-diphosphatase [Streptomyces sp. CG 926]|nr:undecaprenyl-diphosphatase [Streptomyces sp. CG 926]